MTKVKICGITNLEDALVSAKFGADALGFNFYEKSPRYIKAEKVCEIVEQLPTNILKVGVFVNESLDKIAEIATIAKLDAIQLHGEETPAFARELKAKTNLEVIKAFRVSDKFKPEDVLQYEVDAILLDAYSPQEHGGTGETFDWEIARKVQDIFSKMYLAGGLSQNNIFGALRRTSLFAIDTCSKIEREAGKKDKTELINLISKVKHFDWWNEHSKIKGHELSKIKNIYELLNLIHLMPAMYIGSNSFITLNNFLRGFKFSFEMFNNQFDWKNFSSIEFHKFVRNQFNGYELSTLGAESIILKECNNDEEKALDLFFALLEEFKLEKENLEKD